MYSNLPTLKIHIHIYSVKPAKYQYKIHIHIYRRILLNINVFNLPNILFFFQVRVFSSLFFPQPQLLTKSSMSSASVHCSRTHKLHFSTIFSLKMGLMALFTHLKIILLQCFQFSIFSFSKISSIKMDL